MVSFSSPDENLPVPAILIHQNGRLLAWSLPESPLPRMPNEDFHSPAYLAGLGDFSLTPLKNKGRPLPTPILGRFWLKIA